MMLRSQLARSVGTGSDPDHFLQIKRSTSMANQETSRGRAQDRARVAGGQEHEVAYQAGKTGVSRKDVRDTVKEVGNSRKKVEDKLAK
jgi:hypothetical protein